VARIDCVCNILVARMFNLHQRMPPHEIPPSSFQDRYFTNLLTPEQLRTMEIERRAAARRLDEMLRLQRLEQDMEDLQIDPAIFGPPALTRQTAGNVTVGRAVTAAQNAQNIQNQRDAPPPPGFL